MFLAVSPLLAERSDADLYQDKHTPRCKKGGAIKWKSFTLVKETLMVAVQRANAFAVMKASASAQLSITNVRLSLSLLQHCQMDIIDWIIAWVGQTLQIPNYQGRERFERERRGTRQEREKN